MQQQLIIVLVEKYSIEIVFSMVAHWKMLNINIFSLQARHKRGYFLMLDGFSNSFTSCIKVLGWLERKQVSRYTCSAKQINAMFA